MKSRLAADHHHLPRPQRSSLETLAQRACRGIVDTATANPAAHRRLAGKYKLDVFGGPGNVAKASNQLVRAL